MRPIKSIDIVNVVKHFHQDSDNKHVHGYRADVLVVFEPTWWDKVTRRQVTEQTCMYCHSPDSGWWWPNGEYLPTNEWDMLNRKFDQYHWETGAKR